MMFYSRRIGCSKPEVTRSNDVLTEISNDVLLPQDWMQQGMSTEAELGFQEDMTKWMKADVSPPKSGSEESDESLKFGPVSVVIPPLLVSPFLSM